VDKPLFRKFELRLTIEAHQQAAIDEVKKAPEDHVLHVDIDAWADALAEKWNLDCPKLDIEGLYQDPPEPCQVDVSYDHMRYFGSTPPFVAGHRTIVHLPFSGDPDLFQMQASTFTIGGTPNATVLAGRLDLEIEYPDDRPADIAASARQWASKIQRHLNWIEGDLSGFQGRLRRAARAAIVQRKDSILKHQQHVAATALPMKPRDGEVRTYVAQAIERRPPPPATEMSLEKPLPLEPVISDAMYEDIIGTLRSTAVDMERSVATYAEMGEEDLRQVILLPLSNIYRGQATAETFNSEGKADVVLRWDGKNVFVGEMKIWAGEKAFREAIEQLFRYATWRDAGLAVIVFVKQKGLAPVIATARAALEGADYFIEWTGEIEGGFQARIQQLRDADISARLAVLFVHLDH
jgi:hypothetical protein